MSADIVERLRSAGHFYAPPHDAILYEAAAEIVRLRGEVDELRAPSPRYATIAPAEAKGDGMLPDALVPVADEWYRLCERRFAVDKIKISGELAEAIVEAMSAGSRTPQPAGGEAVERDPYAPTDGELLAEFIRICREHKPVGQWPGERVCTAIERLMANQKPFRFITEADMAPERGHNGRGGDSDRTLSGPRRAHPPAAQVQQEWNEAYQAFKGAFDTPLARMRDRSEFAEDARKRLYEFDQHMATHPAAGDKVQQVPHALDVPDRQAAFQSIADFKGDQRYAQGWNDCRATMLAAHPSACELGAVRELVAKWRSDAFEQTSTGVADPRIVCADELEAALQHRGDSRGGEGS